MGEVNSKNVINAVINPQAVIFMGRVPFHKLQHEIDHFLFTNGCNPVKVLYVDYAKPANFHVMVYRFASLSDKRCRHLLLYMDDIVRDKPVAAYDQVKSAFTLSHSALAQEQNPHSKHINEHPVDMGVRQQFLFKEFGYE